MKNKKGISLIVLIVTIIVIIILAAAVILTLNQINNPIDSSRVAQLADNRANINSAIQLYYGKQMAATQGVYDANQIFTKTDIKDEHSAIVTAALVDTAIADGSTYYLLDNGENTVLGISIPTITNATWYLDVNSGLVYLAYNSSNNVPSWMFTDDAKTTMDTTLDTFVKVKVTETDSDGNSVTTLKTYSQAVATAE